MADALANRAMDSRQSVQVRIDPTSRCCLRWAVIYCHVDTD
ncbi:hypothetical protein L917_02234, partial [Phytophthora nicotianae]